MLYSEVVYLYSDLYADIDSRQLKSSKVDPALQVSTTESTVRVMEAYRSYFTRIGKGE